MELPVAVVLQPFEFPAKEPPAWHQRVERWYQLDSAAFGLCEIYARSKLSEMARPEMLFLASPGGCSRTDIAFVRHGAAAPAKFVHTLPNVRGSVLLQLMNWQGPMLCIQEDPNTIESALVQASRMSKPSWVVGCSGNLAFGFCVGSSGEFVLRQKREGGLTMPILEWMQDGSDQPLDLPMNLQLWKGRAE